MIITKSMVLKIPAHIIASGTKYTYFYHNSFIIVCFVRYMQIQYIISERLSIEIAYLTIPS